MLVPDGLRISLTANLMVFSHTKTSSEQFCGWNRPVEESGQWRIALAFMQVQAGIKFKTNHIITFYNCDGQKSILERQKLKSKLKAYRLQQQRTTLASTSLNQNSFLLKFKTKVLKALSWYNKIYLLCLNKY